jgi:hypothetical protein
LNVLGDNDLKHPSAQWIAKAVFDTYWYPTFRLVCFEVRYNVHEVIEVVAGFYSDVRGRI